MIVIVRNGDVTVIAHSDDRDIVDQFLDQQTWKRGGHVVPASRLLRQAFRVIRQRFAKFPRIVAWTRTWRVCWIVDLSGSGGPRLGPFELRADAISAEETWIADNLTAVH